MNRKERRTEERIETADVDALLGQALQQHQAGKVKQAAQIYRRILSSSPDNPDALNLLGLARHQQGDHSGAIELMEKAIRQSPSVPLFHNNLAMALRGAGQEQRATDSLRRAVTLDPAYIDGWVNLGEVLSTTGHMDGAIEAFQAALGLAPHAAIVHFHLAKCFSDKADNEAAIAALRQAIKFEPQFAEAYERLGSVLRDVDRPDDAMNAVQKSLELAPANEKAWFTAGLIHQDAHRLEDALKAYSRALRLSPGMAEAHHNRGTVLRGLDRHDDAIAAYNEALALDPGRDHTRSDRSLTLLAAGRFKEGWRDFRSRRSIAGLREKLQSDPLPADLTGKRLLILRDQGLGDELFFMRFVPALKSRGATVIYRAQSQLVPLFQRLDFLDTVLDENRGEPPGDVEFCLSAGDLPALLDMTSVDHIPPSVTLPVVPSNTSEITEKLRECGPPPYVGLTWRAGIQERNRLSKIAPLQAIAKCLSGVNATVIALQRNPQPGEIDELSMVMGQPVHDMTALNNDLEAMLALLDQLDEYICVSNTNTHLRAALGKPSHVLVPNPADYRWMNRGDNSPWFPGSRIYRQTYDDGWNRAMEVLAGTVAATLGNSRQA